MKLEVVSEKRCILKNMAGFLQGRRQEDETPKRFSSILKYLSDELIKVNMRKIAQRRGNTFSESQIVDEAIAQTEREVRSHFQGNASFDMKRYTRGARDDLKPLARELFELKGELAAARKTERIGDRAIVAGQMKVPFEIIEIGLRGLIEGMLAMPQVDEFTLSTDHLEHFMRAEDPRFPIEIQIQDFTYVIDDDGSIYVDTENLPEKLVNHARVTLVELCKKVYT